MAHRESGTVARRGKVFMSRTHDFEFNVWPEPESGIFEQYQMLRFT